jgi:hypothetical protein
MSADSPQICSEAEIQAAVDLFHEIEVFQTPPTPAFQSQVNIELILNSEGLPTDVAFTQISWWTCTDGNSTQAEPST